MILKILLARLKARVGCCIDATSMRPTLTVHEHGDGTGSHLQLLLYASKNAAVAVFGDIK